MHTPRQLEPGNTSRDLKALSPGRHTLASSTAPVVTSSLSAPHPTPSSAHKGGDPFTGEAALAANAWPMAKELYAALRKGRIAELRMWQGGADQLAAEQEAEEVTERSVVAEFVADSGAKKAWEHLADALHRSTPRRSKDDADSSGSDSSAGNDAELPLTQTALRSRDIDALLNDDKLKATVNDDAVLSIGAGNGHTATRVAEALPDTTVLSVVWDGVAGPDAGSSTEGERPRSPEQHVQTQLVLKDALGLDNLVVAQTTVDTQLGKADCSHSSSHSCFLTFSTCMRVYARVASLAVASLRASGTEFGLIMLQDLSLLVGTMLPHEFEVCVPLFTSCRPH